MIVRMLALSTALLAAGTALAGEPAALPEPDSFALLAIAGVAAVVIDCGTGASKSAFRASLPATHADRRQRGSTLGESNHDDSMDDWKCRSARFS